MKTVVERPVCAREDYTYTRRQLEILVNILAVNQWTFSKALFIVSCEKVFQGIPDWMIVEFMERISRIRAGERGVWNWPGNEENPEKWVRNILGMT